MQNLVGVLGAVSFLGIIKQILEVMLYISLIILSFKAVQALNIYINKNSR